MDIDEIHTPRPGFVLVVHTAVEYTHQKGLGVGLTQHIANEETGQTEDSALNMQTRGFKVKQQHLMSAPSNMNIHQRVDTLAIRHALRFARDTVRKLSLQGQKISTVTILNARPCREVFAAIKNHVKGEANHEGRIKKLVKEIVKLCKRDLKVKLSLSGHGDEEMRVMAAEIAKEKFRRLCRRSPNQRRKRKALRLRAAQNATLCAP